MRRGIIALLVALLIGSSALAADDIAIVKRVQGKVSVKRAGEIHAVKRSDRLQTGDILITGARAQVGVIFHDGSVLTLEEKSFLRIKEFVFLPIEKKFNFHLYLNKGAALFESGKIGTLSPESFSFEIPEGVVGIRGTKFLIEVR
jgi:hypothetical protein